MNSDDKKYQEYLRSIFVDDYEAYYLDTETKEAIPVNKTTVGIKNIGTFWVLKGNDVLDFNGNSLLPGKFDKICNASDGICVAAKNGFTYIINLYTKKIVYYTKYEYVCLKDDYTTFWDKANDVYYLFGPKGNEIHRSTAPITVDITRDNKIAIVRYSLYFKSYDNPGKKIIFDISYPEGYEERYKSDYHSEYLNYGTSFSYVNDLFEKFQVPCEKIASLYPLASYVTLDLHYNDTFLVIQAFSSMDYSKKVIIATKNGNILFNKNFEKRFSKEIIFDDKNLAIFGLNYENEDIVFYDEFGNISAKLTNPKDLILVDSTFLKLYRRHIPVLHDVKPCKTITDKRKIEFKIGSETYYTSSKFCCGKLLIRDINGNYGYLGEEGFIDIEPQYRYATDFIDGCAAVSNYPENYLNRILSFIDINGIKVNSRPEPLGSNTYEGKFKNSYKMPEDEQRRYLTYSVNKRTLLKPTYTFYDYSSYIKRTTKLKPCRQYDNFLIGKLENDMFKPNGYYALDKSTGDFIYLDELGVFTDFYDNYFVINSTTYYPKDSLINLGDFNIRYKRLKRNAKIMSKEDYLLSLKESTTKEDLDEKSKEEEREQQREEQRKKERELLLEKKKLLEDCQRRINQKLSEIMDIKAEIKRLKIYHMTPIPNDFFVELNGVKRINYSYVADLKYYDLFSVDFTGCMIRDIDFSDTNACLNPQEVYNKDMSNGNYSDVTILNYDMTGVNIENAVFTNDFINAYQEGILKRNLK